MLKRLSYLVLALVCGVTVGVWPGGGGTRVAFLSVGQGDCTLIISNGWVALIDVGPRTDTFDAGKRLVVPELRRLGVRKIDCLFLTHPDMDHVGGLQAVASRFRIGRVVISEEFSIDEELQKTLRLANIEHDQLTWISGVNQVRVGEAMLTVATPELGSESLDNEGSLFILIDAGRGSIMTTGDAGFSAESQMTGTWNWDVDILKAGHHGSKGSMSEAWLNTTTPTVVVASCGVRNSYGHPSRDAVARVNNFGAKFLRTDQEGTVTYRASDSGFVRVH